jgi:hypothetical protein
MKTWMFIAVILIAALWYFQSDTPTATHTGETTSRALLPNTDQSRPIMGCGGDI